MVPASLRFFFVGFRGDLLHQSMTEMTLVGVVLIDNNAQPKEHPHRQRSTTSLRLQETIHTATKPLDYDAWLDLHAKLYPTEEEYQKRRAIFHWNAENVVRLHNLAFQNGLTNYQMTIMESPFADWTDEEFDAHYLMHMEGRGHCALAHPQTARKLTTPINKAKVKRRDWREHGIMTPVKSQGQCGSCWTFSTTAVVEAHTCLADGKDCSNWDGLSEQQLVDCSGSFGTFGCNGGWPSAAMEYIKYNQGIEAEDDYPYKAHNHTCATQKKDPTRAQVAEVFNITYQDEDGLENAVANIGPVSIAFQVASDFRFYKNGVYDSFNATSNTTACHNGEERYLNHAVAIVGIDVSERGIPYYIIRNSWGRSWGMEGHFWMKRGVNLCGVSDCASFPIVPAGPSILRGRANQAGWNGLE